MSKPTISVIIPTYNRAALLNRTINSVLNQTFQDFELILVDGSTDNTKELVNDFIKQDSRIKYIGQENSGGPAKPINIGINNSNGVYITILNSDDEILPEKFEKQVAKFDNAPLNVGVIYCGFQYIPVNKKHPLKIIIPKLRGNLFTELLKNSFIGSVTPLIKSECFKKSGFFDVSLPSGEDWDMWIRIAKNYEFDYVPETLAIYHIHGKQISANFDDTIEGFKKILEKYINDISRYPSIHSTHLIRIGIFCCINDNLYDGQKYFDEAIKVKPLQIIAYLNLFLAKMPWLYIPLLIFILKRFTLTGMFYDFK